MVYLGVAKVIFDGKKQAEREAEFLEESERVLGKSLVIFQCDGRTYDSAYVRLKREMGERLGVVVSVDFRSKITDLREGIMEVNGDETVDGILVQLPVLGATKEEVEQIMSTINPEKDVDGLNPKSRFIPAVVRVVERLIEIFKIKEDDRIAVVGDKGAVGVRLMERLKVLGLSPKGFDQGDNLKNLEDFEVVISATGVSGLIASEMVAEGFTGIDLGYPKGDFSPEAVAKASLITPVPGGVGPMTILALYENLGIEKLGQGDF